MTDLVELSETSPFATGDALLVRFAGLRDEILRSVHTAAELTGRLGAFGDEFARDIRRVEDVVDLSRLNVVVVGAEGAGKSTFINALLEADVSTESRSDPGTVAPIHIEGGDGDTQYGVVVGDPTAPVRVCADRADFDAFLLQKHNEDNKKDVIRGRVLMDHPLLWNGLRLVDMPGVAGVSSAVAREA